MQAIIPCRRIMILTCLSEFKIIVGTQKLMIILPGQECYRLTQNGKNYEGVTCSNNYSCGFIQLRTANLSTSKARACWSMQILHLLHSCHKIQSAISKWHVHFLFPPYPATFCDVCSFTQAINSRVAQLSKDRQLPHLSGPSSSCLSRRRQTRVWIWALTSYHVS